MDFRVVVRPAPLRPSRVMTSPSLTVRSMPCRTWDSPYQAFRFSTCSKLRAPLAVAVSGTGGSHVGCHDVFIAGDFRVRTFGKHFALIEHTDGVGELGHHAQIVLDHEYGALGGNFPDQSGDA